MGKNLLGRRIRALRNEKGWTQQELGVIGGAITGVMAGSAFSDLEAACPNRQCTNATDLARRDNVDTLSGVTNALLIGGGVLAATGVVLAIVGAPRTETVQVGFNGRDLIIGGRF